MAWTILELVYSHPDFFGFSGRSAAQNGEGFGCNCANCAREVTAPFGYEDKLVWCLYCGMEAGFVPLIEKPWGESYLFGVTREECLEDKAALKNGNLEQVLDERARRLERIIDWY